MSRKEILEKAIQKAINNGWTGGKYLNWSGDWLGAIPTLEVVAPFPSFPQLKYTTGGVDVTDYLRPPEVMLFDHDFAKALWGQDDLEIENPDYIYPGDWATSPAEFSGPAYIYHLQQMVAADDPIEYLGENI